ncbi:ATP-binding protein [Rugosimonospora acidiphila]|uniref:histidine kinase n=1 Tax=Rugosimonospora acidiphila TaxID=556531 RepID=A0ABP9SCE1_9ACTN
MLIPSVVAVVLWLAASGYLVFSGFYDREVASTVRQVSIPAVTGLSSIQQERRLSVAYLAKPSVGMQGLIDQRRQTDQRLSTLRTVANSALSLAPASIKTRWKTLTQHLDQLPGIRSKIDSGTADRQQVYDFYNGLLDSATDLFDTQARVVPDATAAQGGISATEIFRATDQMSRAGSLVTGAFGSHTLSEGDYLQFVGLVGAYHAELTDVAPHLRPDVRRRYAQTIAGDPWKRLVNAENAVIDGGRWSGTVPADLEVDAASWDTLTTQVSVALVDLTVAQADEVSAQALHTGDNQLLTALLGSLVALAIAVGAIVWALRQSQVLVDRALSVRLAQLGRDAAAVVDQRLPEMMARLRRREKADPAIELPTQDYGSDEIGQLAAVLNRSLQRAVGAAADEATTRAAGLAMLMGVARRPQRPLQHGLQVIENLQTAIGDERVLAQLFDVNHQLAQARRFLENLIILAGGQTGRRFHKPVGLRRVLLATMGETQQYQRITLRPTVDVALVGSAVAGTTHLLAELFDNALAFSPPTSTVWVNCTRATRGVVIEIEDAGVGMLPDDLDRANELLATAPTPDVAALKDGAQIGLWVVAELAKRAGIQVTLRTSAYGGLLAVVLLPDRLIAPDSDPAPEPDPEPSLAAAGAPLAGAQPSVPLLPPPGSMLGFGQHGMRPVSPPPAPAGRSDTNGSTRPIPFVQMSQDARGDRPNGTVNGHHRHGAAAPEPPRPAPPAYRAGGTPPSPSPSPRPRLPERQPQQHLAPELRDQTDPAAPDEPTRSPEETRSRFAQYQKGWQAGRSGNGNPPTGDDQNGTA